MIVRVSNSNARRYVQDRVIFKGSNTFSEYRNNCYVVFSYGYHYPMFVFKDKTWYENSDSYSKSTSRHRSQLHPQRATIKLCTDSMKQLYSE